MAVNTLTVTVGIKLPQWLRAYVRAAVLWAWIRGRAPDEERIVDFIVRRTKFVVEQA
ncbi:hypothetical protein ACL598_16890 [Bordetella bronchialis]|uniref:hypothetical protein n=1 Tax=Bordetella bronchialis TaxID=463025 RepID=UPI003D054AB0